MSKLLTINLLQRVVVAVAGIPFLLWLINVGGVWFSGFFSLLALLAVYEFHHLAAHKASPPPLWLAVLITLLFQLDFAFHLVEVWELLLAVVLFLFVLELFSKEGSPLLNLGSVFPGLLYVNLTFGALLRLRLDAPEGSGVAMVYLLFLCVWAADIFAYFGGSTLGGKFIHRKLFERLSPHKTWEGFLFGLAGSVSAALIYGNFFPSLPLNTALMTGLLIGFASPAGDLVESMFKRDAGVKDSSGLIPGHGGVLDRFDTIMFVSPFLYFIAFYL
ncbi:phosphatidate cytidylyltransferase [Chlorobium ferrooxidans]|uniref:Phosphatidate cytidylyltransferase n=1 Tax=Chlorobium ferrooxidans DSM 13031 TaxID=377431 RepID=Q0YSJ0_9CHLB|nr:phosphatidate cytidylyltransferase [Chlorobium ferrooxidans]EAT59209.1 Phosphatidate cytidylyltransferase [Chlorobium ferrooxidans DSM 13031]